MIPSWFIFVGGLISFFGGLSYLIDTLKGKTQPNRVTWVLWGIAPAIAFFAQMSKGVGLSSLLTFVVGFDPLLVFIASFLNKKSTWKLGVFDYGCGLLAIVALAMWQLTQEPNVALFFSILADLFAGIPTLVKSYTHPHSESPMIYVTGIISSSLTLLAIPEWSFQYFGFPLHIFILNTALALVIVLRRRVKVASLQ